MILYNTTSKGVTKVYNEIVLLSYNNTFGKLSFYTFLIIFFYTRLQIMKNEKKAQMLNDFREKAKKPSIEYNKKPSRDKDSSTMQQHSQHDFLIFFHIHQQCDKTYYRCMIINFNNNNGDFFNDIIICTF